MCINTKCSFCDSFSVTDDHIASDCTTLTEYNSVSQYLHWKIGKVYRKEITTNLYEHHPDPLREKSN